MPINIQENKSLIKHYYRPEIDGLRAFAVVSVIINHFNKEILPNGYLGVDIFFVISGFVITSSFYQKPSKNFKDFISGFYERRIKRLFPALSFFVLIISISICFFNPDPNFSLKTGLTSLFGISNLYLLQQSINYFAQSAEVNVFTHTWSLGVEEQFYVLFPLLIWFSGFGRETQNGARNLFLIVGALAIASLIGFLYLYPINQPAAYFLMPTRFWEMASGCLLFIGFQKRKSIEKFLKKVPPILVITLIIGAMYLPISLTTASTVAVVALSNVLIGSLNKQTTVFKIFTNPKVVYIGQISYSLYLWHWGILSISRWTIGIHWWSLPLQVALMLVLAVASYQYIETPLRKSNWFKERWKTIIFGGGAIVTLSGGLITLARPLNGFMYLGNKKYLENLANTEYLNSSIYSGLSREKCPSGGGFDLQQISNCTLPSSNGRHILSIGDSQTGDLIFLLNKLHNIDGFGIYWYYSFGMNFPSLTTTSNRPGKNNPNLFREKYEETTLAFFDYYFSQLKRGDIIILSSRYELLWGDHPIPKSERNLKFTFYDSNNNILDREQSYNQWKKLFENITEKSHRKGIRVIAFNSTPTFPHFVFNQGTQWFNTPNKKNFGVKRDYLINHSQRVHSAFNSLASKYSNFEVFDVFSEICPKSQVFCTNEKNADQSHLSQRGMISLYKSLFKKLN